MDLNMWMDQCPFNLAFNTLKNYRYRFDKYIRPYDLPLNMTRLQVQQFINGLDAPGDKKTLALLSTLMTYAVDYGLLDRNPCVRIRTKRYIKPAKAWLPFDKLGDYGNMRLPNKYNDHVRFMATTGLRLGEAYALTVADIEKAMATGWLTIDKSQSVGAPLDVTKSNKARRVPYIDYGYGVIKCMPSKGQPFPKSRQFTECLKVHGDDYTLHSLRYTYAHMLAVKGVHPKVAQRLLGHSTIGLTLDIYTQVHDDDLENVRRVLLQ